jgi:hypothetical protein
MEKYMEALNFSRKSWHFRLAEHYGGLLSSYSTNLCDYMKAVFKGFLMCSLIVTVGTIFAIGMVDFYMYLIFEYIISHGDMVIHDIGFIGSAINFVALILVVGNLVYAACSWIKDKFTSKEKTVSEPSFIAESYKALKDKYCVKVEFKE